MSEKTWIEQVVEKAVQEALEGQIPQLRSEVVRRVVAEVGPQVSGAPQNTPASLLKAISAIQTGTTQREILRSLLDHSSQYCGRCALFVVKAGAATGWQGRGFTNHEEVKDFAFDVSHGLAGRAMQSRISFAGSSSEIDPRFISHFGTPGDGHVLLLPLLLKERVAALVYSDAGAEGKLDQSALEVLVVSASAWLEVAASRKAGPKDGTAEAPVERASAAASPMSSAPAPAPSFSDPFSSHAPAHIPPRPPEPAQEFAAAASASANGSGEVAPESAAAVASSDSAAALSPEDQETHRKAQRFARLLVDEIKLYNQAKVTEGRKSKDLYDRLKDDIDKSLASYQKRYGNTVAAGAQYFQQELVRSLAEDDASVMGANFQR